MKQQLNEQFRRMQKLAGIITEGMEGGGMPSQGDYMFDYEGGAGEYPTGVVRTIPLPQAAAGEAASEFESMARSLRYAKDAYGDEDPNEEPSAILIFNSKLANEPGVVEFEKNLNFDDDEEY